MFDIDKDHFAEHTGWVRGDDAFLVRDLNANGKIDDVGEMFGNATTSGFAALAALDSSLFLQCGINPALCAQSIAQPCGMQ